MMMIQKFMYLQMLSVKRRLAAIVIARRIFIEAKEYNTLQLSPV
jgi:hypothetical protein